MHDKHVLRHSNKMQQLSDTHADEWNSWQEAIEYVGFKYKFVLH